MNANRPSASMPNPPVFTACTSGKRAHMTGRHSANDFARDRGARPSRPSRPDNTGGIRTRADRLPVIPARPARRPTSCGRSASGFSLVEILIVIAALGVLASVAVVSLTGAPDEARKAKLEQDVAIVNNAIDTYIAAGGDPAQLTEGNVISSLQQRVAPAPGPGEIVGPQGPFLDTRVISKPTDFAWSALYTTDPQPRFYVVQSRDGVVFDLGPAMAVGGAPERLDAARGKWVWDYTTATAPGQAPTFVPTAVDAPYTSTNVPVAAVPLDAPVISPGSMSANLWGFPLSVSIANPNPSGSSRVYYKVGEGGNFTLYDNTPFNVDPGATLYAVAVTLDPSRYYNSPQADATYSLIPLELAVRINAPASVTYAEAGGLFIGLAQLSPVVATITLEDTSGGGADNLLVDDAGEDKYIPAPYVSSANFTIRYTTDGSDPLTSGTAIAGPSFSGYYSPVSVSLGLDAWGTNSSMAIRAAALASNTEYFASSAVASNNVGISRTPLGSPLVSPTNQIVTFSVTVTMGAPTNGPLVGTNAPIRYSVDNTAPSALSGFSYGGPFSLSSFAANEQKSVRAVTVPPSSLTNWLDVSPEAVRTFTGPAIIGSGIPSGALVGGATLNSTFNGNVTVAYPTNGVVSSITYNQNAVINGSLYVPGTPTVAQNSPYIPRWTITNDLQFSNRIYGIVEGQSPSPRVVDLTGPTTPTNYTITFNNNSYITGKIFRRIERYTLTPLNVATFPVKTSSASLSLSGPVAGPLSATNVANVTLNTASVGSVTLLPGTYGNMAANNNSKFVLGDAANPDNLVTYSFDRLSLNSEADLVIVGRVTLNIRNGFEINNGSVLGNVAHPDWLQINVWNGNVAANSGSSIYGRLFVPNNNVALNNGSVLNGSVSSKTLNLNSSATVFSLSPANSPNP